MKILWITNNPMPPICRAIGGNISVSGGWMFSSLKMLSQKEGYDITVASIYGGNEYIDKQIDGIRYILLPLNGKSSIDYNKTLESRWLKVKEDVRPDVVHIHGSEFPHGLAYVRACGSRHVVVSIQGIISEISKHYCDGLSNEVVYSATIRDILRRDGIAQQKAKFERRGKYEIELIKSVRFLIGRTDWDKAHIEAINPEASYFFCGETLRSSFYKVKWNFRNCEPYSIFVSQGSYPIKGLHIVLKALPSILKIYPNCKVYIGGVDIINLPWYRISGYGRFLKTLIKRLNLSEHIVFCGKMSEEEMLDRYLKSNIFICSSSLENSSNSVGEAQLLKMPLLCSFVGGVPDIVNYNKNVLYRFSDDVLLTEKILEVFRYGVNYKPNTFDLKRYDAESNLKQLENVYRTVINSIYK